MNSRRPNFVGVGVPRAGTTWLHELIGSHENGFTPRNRKEVHYFDREFDRGDAWYLSFFADAEEHHIARGEFTPHYLYDQRCIERIQSFGIPTVLLTLRDPVDRTWSNYLFKKRQDGFTGTLAEFLRAYPEMISWSRYDEHLGPWLDAFDSNLCLLIYEAMSTDPDSLRCQLGEALGLELSGFRERAEARVNASMVPRRPWLYKRMVRVNKWMFDHDLDVLASTLKGVPGAMNFLRSANQSNRTALAPSDLELELLLEKFSQPTSRLADMTGLDLSGWRGLE